MTFDSLNHQHMIYKLFLVHGTWFHLECRNNGRVLESEDMVPRQILFPEIVIFETFMTFSKNLNGRIILSAIGRKDEIQNKKR